jgi:hypothetical protein
MLQLVWPVNTLVIIWLASYVAGIVVSDGKTSVLWILITHTQSTPPEFLMDQHP